MLFGPARFRPPPEVVGARPFPDVARHVEGAGSRGARGIQAGLRRRADPGGEGRPRAGAEPVAPEPGGPRTHASGRAAGRPTASGGRRFRGPPPPTPPPPGAARPSVCRTPRL